MLEKPQHRTVTGTVHYVPTSLALLIDSLMLGGTFGSLELINPPKGILQGTDRALCPRTSCHMRENQKLGKKGKNVTVSGEGLENQTEDRRIHRGNWSRVWCGEAVLSDDL